MSELVNLSETTVIKARTATVFELTNPAIDLRSGHVLALQSLRVRVERRMLARSMVDWITVRSYAHEPVALDLELRYDADSGQCSRSAGLPTRTSARCAAARPATRSASRRPVSTATSARVLAGARPRRDRERAPRARRVSG
jgi:hypothetical protein